MKDTTRGAFAAKRMGSASAVLLLAMFAASPVPAQDVSVHREHMLQFGDVQPSPEPDRSRPPAVSPPPVAKGPSADRIVYGYYPYWVTGYDELRWDLLSHVAWFAIELGSDGLPTATHGWPSSWTGLVDTAHAQGVRVDVTFTLFSTSGIETLVTSTEYRNNAITTIIDAIVDGNADGASIDFEGVGSGASAGFTLFLQQLRAAMDTAGLTDKQISVAGPAVDWSGAFDMDAILQVIDIYFIMGYAYFYSGSSYAGPTGILMIDDFWRTYTSHAELWSMAYYSILDDPADRKKIVMGVPYYGREWITDDATMASSVVSSVGAVTYEVAMGDLSNLGISSTWDDGALTPWYTFTEGSDVHQVYFEDADSLAWKYRFINEQGLGGAGIWALRYDAGYTALWDELEAAFVDPFVPWEGDKEDPIVVDELPYTDSRDTSDLSTGGCYFNYYSCDDSLDEWGKEFVYQVEICHAGELQVSVAGDNDDVDNDVHILSALSEDACLARGHTTASWEVDPGTYYVVVDTYVDSAVLRSGPYDLTVEGVGIPNPQCEDGLSCVGGECVDPGAQDAGPDGGDLDADTDGDTDADTDGDAGQECYPVTSEEESCACDIIRSGKSASLLSLLFQVVVQ